MKSRIHTFIPKYAEEPDFAGLAAPLRRNNHGRQLAYVKPRIGENRFGGESVTYEGIGATKKWERIESYGPKFVENIVQAISRDLLCFAMRNLSFCQIVGHVHDEVIIECGPEVSVQSLGDIMSRSPDWMPGILIRGDGYQCDFYQKDS